MLYDKNGYLNVKVVRDLGVPFIFVIGGRGTGKTYGFLSDVLDRGEQFILMRRTQTQVDLIKKPDFSPFNSICRDRGLHLGYGQITKYNSAVYKQQQDTDGEWINSGSPIGYTAALSTISSMRGFDASSVSVLVYDEFIPERHEKAIKNEASAFLNAYETINRNRELTGHKPLTAILLANSNDISNPLFIELGLVDKAVQMIKTGQEISVNKQRGIALIMLMRSPISDRKQDTALYRLNDGSEFSRMALKNLFEYEDDTVRRCPINEYRPVVAVGQITIYRHKSKQQWYVSMHSAGSPDRFTAGPSDLLRFRKHYYNLYNEYLKRRVFFENQTCAVLFDKYFEQN